MAFALLIFFGSMSSSVLFLHLKRNADEQKERAEDRETKMARMASHRLIESANLSGDRGDYAAKALKLAYVQTLMREEDPQARVNAVRLGTALKQCPIPLQIWPQSEGANQLAFNHEGTRVAVASGDKVHIYDVATGTVAGPPLEHPGPVSSIAFSPDGKRLASGCRNETRLTPNSPLRNLTEGEGEARLWDVATGRLLVGPMVLGLSVSRVGFTQSNWVVALGRIWEAGTGIHDALQVWDGNDGRSLSRPVSLSGDLIAVAFSPNGRHLAVSWRDLVGSRATLWDLKEMRAFPLVRTDTGHKDGSRYRILTSLAFSPAGDWLLTAGDDGRLDIWDATSGQPSGGPLEAREKVAIVKAAFSPTGIIAAASEDKTVRVWHSASRRLIGRPIKYDQPVTDLAFGPDGVSLICASQDGTIRVWDGNTGDPLGPVLVHTGAPVQAQWSPDGLALLTAGQDGCVRLWDATVFGSWGQAWNLPRGVNGPVWYNHGGEQILVPSDDTARIYEATTGRPVTPVLPHKARVVRAWFSPDDRYVITLATLVDHRGNLYFWDATSGASLVAPIEDAGEVTDVCWRPDGIGLAISATGNMCSMSKYSGISYVWELDPRVPKIRQVAQLDHERVVNNAVIHPDGRLAATATGQFDEPGEAGVWDVASGKLVRPSFPHPRKVNSVAFSPDARNLVTGCDDGHARIFEIRSGVLEREIRLGYPVTRSPRDPRWLPSCHGRWRCSQRRRPCLGIGNRPTRSANRYAHGPAVVPPTEFGLPATALRRIEISNDGQLILTSGDDGIARVFELETGMPVSSPMQHSGAVDGAFSGDGRRISTVAQSGKGQSIHVWELTDPRLPKDEMVRVAKLVSGRTIDESGATSPLDPAAHQELLFDLRSRYPGEFRRSDRNIKHWYEQQSRRIESELRLAREEQGERARRCTRDRAARGSEASGPLVSQSPDECRALAARGPRFPAGPHLGVARPLERGGRGLLTFGRSVGISTQHGDLSAPLGLWDAAAVSYAQTIQLLARLPGPKRWQYLYEAVGARGLGLLQLRAGRWREAVESFTKAVRSPRDYDRSHFDRGLAYTELGEWGHALEDFERADPLHRSWRGQLHLARAEAALGRWQDVLVAARKVVALIGSNDHLGKPKDERLSEALVEFGILEEFKVDDYYAWFISANNCDGNDQIGALRRSIELKSDFAPAWLMAGEPMPRPVAGSSP